MFCLRCGTELAQGDMFCKNCGAKAEIPTEQPSNNNNVVYKTSEGFLREKIFERKMFDPNYYIEPEIPERLLINAVLTIAPGINPAKILAVQDNSPFSGVMDGIVFTGTSVYLMTALGTQIIIPLKNIKETKYSSENVQGENGACYKKVVLEVCYDEKSVIVTSNEVAEQHLDLINNILQGLPTRVERVTEKSCRYNVLSELGDNITGAYLDIILNYLKSGTGTIGNEEYSEFISLISRVNISADLSEKLRENRLNIAKSEKSFAELVQELSDALVYENVHNQIVFQSLFKDLLLVKPENIDKWNLDSNLIELKKLLNITDYQADAFSKTIKYEKRIINERLEDNHIRDLSNEILALANGVGISLSALTLTNNISSALFGGFLALNAIPASVMLLSLASIGGTNDNSSKAIKYFSGTSQLEKCGIRISALQHSVEIHKKSFAYITEDSLWITEKLNKLYENAKDSADDIKSYLAFATSVGEASKLLHKKCDRENCEILLAKIPLDLPLERFTELIAQNPDRIEIQTHFYRVYPAQYASTVPGQQNLNNIVYRRAENISYDDAKKTYTYLNLIGFFDVKSSAMAQGQVITKKGIDAVKNLFN